MLGAQAGRERYEQIMGTVNKVKDDPRVQEKAHQAADLGQGSRRRSSRTRSPSAASAAADEGEAVGQSATAPTCESQLNPDNVALQDNPYPQGDLP